MSLPKGFKRLEYIQSSGTQYVDTLFKPNQNTGVTIDFQLNAVSGWQCVFGARNTANNVGSYALWHSGSAFGFYFASANKTWSSLSGTARHTVVANKNEATANGTDSVSITFSAFTGNYSLMLFAANSAGSVQSNASMKLYSCQIYDNGTLVRDFIPCQNADGEIGLWDDVNSVFYGNAGTGEFIAGPEAQTVPKAPANFRVESESDTLVTLAWDASDDAVGYRLYRQGQLLADITETSVSVEVEPFAGAVFTLTAYNENGEGAGTSLTHFSIPDNPLLYLITDRTQKDVAERNPKGYYAASDLNRVGYAIDYLAPIIRGYGYTLEVDTKTDWTDEDWKLTGEMVKYLQSLNNLKAVFSTLVELPETMEKINYQDANNIEQLLLTIDETIVRVVAGFTRANAYGLRSGAKGLPASQSDRGRNWGQLDAMGTTWANWQLATWYLLLYGNLKAEGVVE